MPVLPPEARILVLASRPRPGSDEPALAELVSSPVDWLTVGRLAERAKLLPVLWNRLRAHAGAIPEVTAALLRRQASVSEFRMALTETTLQSVVQQLAAENIRVMLLKGAALAVTVYPSFAARPMGDLDILVEPDMAAPAWARLRATGWKLELEGGEEFYDSHHHLPGLVDPRGLNIVVEVHRTLLPRPGPFVLDEREIWRDARPVRVGSTDAWVPSDVHQLLHLSIHFAWSHELSGGLIRTVRDVATLLEQRAIDWKSFTDVAERCRAGTCAYWTLTLAQTLAGAAVPEEVLHRLRPRQPPALNRMLERAYIATSILGACPSMHVTRMLWSAGVRPRASHHGSPRPWHMGEAFNADFQRDGKMELGKRIKSHVSGISGWLRFVRILGSSQRIV